LYVAVPNHGKTFKVCLSIDLKKFDVNKYEDFLKVLMLKREISKIGNTLLSGRPGKVKETKTKKFEQGKCALNKEVINV